MEKANVTRRSLGLGGTDIGAIIGVNPWKSKMDVYLEKVGITEPQEDNEAMYWGREMEPVLAKRYYKETHRTLYLPFPEQLPFRHPDIKWYLGSPDALFAGNVKDPMQLYEGGVDFKTTGRRNDYGEPGTDEVPPWVGTQCHWYMGLTGAEWWDVAVLFFAPRREFQIYRLQRNQEIIDNLTESGREFWEGNVIPRVPPPIDASEGSKRLLAHLYPKDVEDLFALNDAHLVQLLKINMDEQDKLSKEIVLLQNKIKDLIGNHAGIVTSLGKITWKKQKDRQVTDWKAAFDMLAEIAGKISPDIGRDVEESIKLATKTNPGPRVFRAWFKKED